MRRKCQEKVVVLKIDVLISVKLNEYKPLITRITSTCGITQIGRQTFTN